MAIYSLIQYTSTIICEMFLQYPADFQFLYWDLVLNFLPIVFVGYTATADRLSIEKPRDTLFSVTNIAQILVMFGIQFAGQIVSVVIYSQVESDHYKQFGGFDNGKA
jgi:magnesium-transporting ATPase (P-type)